MDSTVMMDEKIDYENLDPGIRDVVRMLNADGFRTTDSGDGLTKRNLGWPEGEYLPFPHVVVDSTPDSFVSLSTLLLGWFLAKSQMGKCKMPEQIEATYSPMASDGKAVVLITWDTTAV